MAAKSGMKKTESAAALDAFIEAVGDALKKGDQVTLVGFGTFLVREREARTGRNPRSGETIEIAASRLPSFKAGKGLKDAVN
ncbi:MAG: DNA-binding protein HU [Halothiobacillus sp. 14-55-98]|nr:MAG: DNA-binding protein HU [Halothiobacillus sp. 14-55-98]OZB79467.1 MAG: DNA-binding protein HU [Halothiobacillus sp. 13-55-115]